MTAEERKFKDNREAKRREMAEARAGRQGQREDRRDDAALAVDLKATNVKPLGIFPQGFKGNKEKGQ